MDSITSPSKTYTHITHPTETVDTHAYNSSQSTDYIRSSRASLHRSRVCVVRTETPFELLISFNTQSTFFFVVENAILFVEPFVVVRRVLFSRLTESLCCARLQISSFWYEMFLRQNAPSQHVYALPVKYSWEDGRKLLPKLQWWHTVCCSIFFPVLVCQESHDKTFKKYNMPIHQSN